MQATLTSASLLRVNAPHSSARRDERNDARVVGAAATDAVGRALDSSTLLQGQKTVAISHNGAVYRLQATKLGKLILTK